MLFGFDTENEARAAGALLVYAVYRSRDAKRGPSGYDMWEQIERFTRRAAKRADDVSGFLNKFKREMACGTINPRWCKTGIAQANATFMDDGSVLVHGGEDGPRDFMISITESSAEEQKKIIETLYEQSECIILLVRDRLEREKPVEGRFSEVEEDA